MDDTLGDLREEHFRVLDDLGLAIYCLIRFTGFYEKGEAMIYECRVQRMSLPLVMLCMSCYVIGCGGYGYPIPSITQMYNNSGYGAILYTTHNTIEIADAGRVSITPALYAPFTIHVMDEKRTILSYSLQAKEDVMKFEYRKQRTPNRHFNVTRLQLEPSGAIYFLEFDMHPFHSFEARDIQRQVFVPDKTADSGLIGGPVSQDALIQLGIYARVFCRIVMRPQRRRKIAE